MGAGSCGWGAQRGQDAGWQQGWVGRGRGCGEGEKLCGLEEARAPLPAQGQARRALRSTGMVGLLPSPGTARGLLGRGAPASDPQLVQVPLWVHETPVLQAVRAHASLPGTQGTAAGQCFPGRMGALGSRGVCYLGIAAITWGK